MAVKRWALTTVCAVWGAAYSHAQQLPRSLPLTLEQQGSFFIGGAAQRGEPMDGAGRDPSHEEGGRTITTGQMYVQYQIPPKAKRYPVVMVHGGGLSGQSYETTPDGRIGWSEYFVRAGRATYVVDQVGRGRSGFDATSYNAARLGKRVPKALPSIGIVSREHAWTWFRIGPKYGTAYPDTQFPVEASDAFFKMSIPDLTASLPSPNPNDAALATLGQKIGGAIMIGHSQSFMFPERAALLNPKAVKGIVSLESGYACASTFSSSEQVKLAKIPILIIFGDHLNDAAPIYRPRWRRAAEDCKNFVASIRQRGGDVTFLHLPDIGIYGNSHMLMIDKNSLRIADIILRWIDEHVDRPTK